MSDELRTQARRLSWLPAAAFWAASIAVGVLSITPVDRLPPQVFDVWDKAQHAAGFLVLTLLGYLGHPTYRRRVGAGLLLYGAAIEFAQSATGWRHGDFGDWLADASGVGMGTLVYLLWRTLTKTSQ
jgi:VanZ family protein